MLLANFGSNFYRTKYLNPTKNNLNLKFNTKMLSTGIGGQTIYNRKVNEGAWTQTVYNLISEAKYQDAVNLLEHQLTAFPLNRAALSILAWCYYYLQDFVLAAEKYEKLVKAYPEVTEYKVLFIQTLYKSGNYQEAQQAAQALEDSQYAPRVSDGHL